MQFLLESSLHSLCVFIGTIINIVYAFMYDNTKMAQEIYILGPIYIINSLNIDLKVKVQSQKLSRVEE